MEPLGTVPIHIHKEGLNGYRFRPENRAQQYTQSRMIFLFQRTFWHLSSALRAMRKAKATREHPAGRCSGSGRHAAAQRGAAQRSSARRLLRSGKCPSTFAAPGSGNDRRLVAKARAAAKNRMADQRTTLGRGGGRAQAGRGGAPTGSGQTEQLLHSTVRPARWR